MRWSTSSITRAVALFAVNADMGAAESGRRRPVDGAHVVAFVVVAQLVGIQAAAAQPRGVPAGEQRMHRLARQKAEALARDGCSLNSSSRVTSSAAHGLAVRDRADGLRRKSRSSLKREDRATGVARAPRSP